ncbi:hypothetical protein FOPG_17159 [Fusarium oxysporum f. sp. conglutinans race 2 54008]|uniref:Uncharacterized protein n=1 Tax=Fusarium oxysporum f. sp. conglutinans race 2 54008 TaxID=1089457 RepID=X0H3V4_FUSOX|nr:hypothetical protein FOPG_17159 [Fusarium oxysporum f. sp. conglutinans race 2 54008]
MSATDESRRSYAAVTRSSTCMPEAASGTATSTVPLVPTIDTLYCTIDVSRIQYDDTRRLAGTIRATNTGTRVLRDDLSSIKVDTVSRNAISNEINKIRLEVAETFGREDDTELAKVAWLGRRDDLKVFGSMVVYFKKRPEAKEFSGEGHSRQE